MYEIGNRRQILRQIVPLRNLVDPFSQPPRQARDGLGCPRHTVTPVVHKASRNLAGGWQLRKHQVYRVKTVVPHNDLSALLAESPGKTNLRATDNSSAATAPVDGKGDLDAKAGRCVQQLRRDNPDDDYCSPSDCSYSPKTFVSKCSEPRDHADATKQINRIA